MAADVEDPKLKAELEKQAAAFNKLAAERARKLGLAIPASSDV